MQMMQVNLDTPIVPDEEVSVSKIQVLPKAQEKRNLSPNSEKEVDSCLNSVMNKASINITTVASDHGAQDSHRVSIASTDMVISDNSDKGRQSGSIQNEFTTTNDSELLHQIDSSSNLQCQNSNQDQSPRISDRVRSNSPIELSSDSSLNNGGHGMLQLKSLILEFPKNAPEGVFSKITKIRQDYDFNQTQNQIEESVDGQSLQLILRSWFYNTEISVIKNIGFILRHFYLTDSFENEILERTRWKLFAANDEGENIPIITRKSAILQIKSEAVIVMRNQFARLVNNTAKQLFKTKKVDRKDSDFSVDSFKKTGIQKKPKKSTKELKKKQLKKQIQKSANKPEDHKTQTSEEETNIEIIDVTKATEGQFFNPPIFPKHMVDGSEKSQNADDKKSTKEKKVKEKKEKKAATQFSSCKNFAINPSNTDYFTHPPAVDFLASIKSEVFKTRQDLDKGVILKLNSFSPVCQYKVNETSKYIHIKCNCCKLFSYWFQNVDGKPIEELKNEGNDNLNLIWFRGINQNHARTDHFQIDFN